MAASMHVEVARHVVVVIVVRHELARMVVEVGRIVPMGMMAAPTMPATPRMAPAAMMPVTMAMRRSNIDVDSATSIMNALRFGGRSIHVDEY
jgi:hypothetical protein